MKVINLVIDLSEQKATDADPKAKQQIIFTGNVSGINNRLVFFIIEDVKEPILNFSQRTVKEL